MSDRDARRDANGADLGPRAGNVGVALRHVYDEMVQEGVPDELLSLLGKLS